MAGKVKLPRGANNTAITLTPNVPARASTVLSSLSSAQTITLDANTSLIEVNSLSQGVYLKYATGVTAANNGFDEFIPAGGLRHYVVPNGVTQISLIEQNASAIAVVIEK